MRKRTYGFCMVFWSFFLMSGILIGKIDSNEWKQKQRRGSNQEWNTRDRIEESSRKQKEGKEREKREPLPMERTELEKRLAISYEEGKREKGREEYTEEERMFLEEHLYGDWRFSDQILTLSETDRKEEKSNFSYIGREIVKEYIWVLWEEDEIQILSAFLSGSDFFSNTQDPYLVGIYGGFEEEGELVYRIETMETGQIRLDHVFYENGYEEVKIEWMKGFVHVTCDYVDSWGESRLMQHPFANDIYIDPNDINTIYVDFCGLWKMRRVFQREDRGSALTEDRAERCFLPYLGKKTELVRR